jgi:hypothetical protein
MDSVITPIALIVAGVLAASGFIISKSPNAKQLIDKLVPFQGFLGVGLLVWGVIDVIRILPHIDEINAIGSHYTFYPIAVWVGLASEILLGFLLGMPLIAKFIPGESAAEQRAMDMQKKIVPYQTLLGFVGIGVAIVLLYYYFKFH